MGLTDELGLTVLTLVLGVEVEVRVERVTGRITRGEDEGLTTVGVEVEGLDLMIRGVLTLEPPPVTRVGGR